MSLSVKLKSGTPQHDKLVTAIKERREFSKRKMGNFHRQWSDADDSVRAYIHEKDVDKKRKDKKTFNGELDYVTLEVPYVYGTIMTAHTYYASVMLSRQPVWQFSARHGEAQDSVMAVEAVMDYQLRSGSHLPVMYNWLYDMAKYSLGIVGTYWCEEEKVITTIQEVQNTIMGVPFVGKKTVQSQQILKGYAGNKLFNVRPYDFYPDPRVPLWKFQEGEFVIYETSEGYSSIIATEHSYPGYYCNLDKMKDLAQNKVNNREQGSSRVELPLQPGETGQVPGAGFFKISEAYIKIIPQMWGLGDSKRVEIWCFQLAEDEVIISAKPLGAYHAKFPFGVMEGNFGSEEFAKFGMLEIIRPLTDILTWLVNSHFYNVRRILNNQLVVDPSRVVMKDLTKPGQRIIRLKPTAYGTPLNEAVYQLQQTDVTRSHLSDAQYIEQMIQRISSVVDNVMGVQNSGGRKTATEVRNATGWSTSRLKTPVEYNSALALDPLSQMMLSNTQQYLDLERKYAIAGNTLENAQKFVEVNPQAIAGDYDFVPVDGALPIDRLAQANFWKELLMQMSRSPQLMMEWDLSGMIAQAMKLQGERNIDRFRRQPPAGVQMNVNGPEATQQLQQQAQAGNMIPLSPTNPQVGGGRSGRPRSDGRPNRISGGPGSSGGNVRT
jgi:hypothetical protein